MKRLLVAILSASLLLTGCTTGGTGVSGHSGVNTDSNQSLAPDESTQILDVDFDGLGDPELLQHVEDSVLASTVEQLSNDDYVIESVVATYISKEYLEELNYNSKENLYFGYSLAEIESQFDGAKYVFGLGENGETEVTTFEGYDDTFDQVLENVAIGSGVILVCVTVSVIAGAIALPAAATVSTVFAASATSGAAFALGSGALGAIAGGAITGFETGNVEASLKSAALSGSEAFKWGAITGVITGGIGKVLKLKNPVTSLIRTPRESEKLALQKFGGTEQTSFLNGVEVPWGTAGSSRPDVYIPPKWNKPAVAMEVKNYDLKSGLPSLESILNQQINKRNTDLPPGTIQAIVLDVGGRGYSKQFIEDVRKYLTTKLDPIYRNIRIELLL